MGAMIEKDHQHDYRANSAKTKVVVKDKEREKGSVSGKKERKEVYQGRKRVSQILLTDRVGSKWLRKERPRNVTSFLLLSFLSLSLSAQVGPTLFLLPFFPEFNDYYREGGTMTVMMMCLLQSLFHSHSFPLSLSLP